jgi:hypothetical protein
MVGEVPLLRCGDRSAESAVRRRAYATGEWVDVSVINETTVQTIGRLSPVTSTWVIRTWASSICAG